jgi:hypothetical protein
VEATSATERGTSIALFRIAMGLCVVWTVGSVVASGVVDPLWLDRAHGGIRHLRPTGVLAWLGGATPTVVHSVTAASLVLGAALVVGLGGRLTALLAVVLVGPLTGLNGDAGGSYDLLLRNGLWLLVLAPTTTTLSLDCRMRTGRWTSDEPVGVWARGLIAFQLVLMYTSTGLQKVSAYWTPGGDFSALYYILQQPSWHRFDMSWAAYVFPLTQLATAITWLWEVGNPLLLLAVWAAHDPSRPGRLRAWTNRLHVRAVFVGLGLVMHTSLLVLMDVGPFGPLSLAFYAALYRPDEWEGLARRLAGRA